MVVEYTNIIPFDTLFSSTTNQFLTPFVDIVDTDIRNKMRLTFEISEKQRERKLTPILQLAKPHDAKAIVGIYLDIYKGMYPYKEMEDGSEVKRMIKSPEYRWILFKHPKTEKTLGCFTYHLDFKNKRGYMRGFNVPPRLQGKVDSMKALIGSMIGIWSELKDEIYVWYSENRTSHTSSQYLASVCGIKPIAFLPNKDVFFGKVESDLMQIAYDSKALKELRSTITPRIIPEVKRCYEYSNNRYNLGKVDIYRPSLALDLKKVEQLKKKINVSVERLKFDNYHITFSFENSIDHFSFLFTPRVQNIEKTEYKVSSLEALAVFIVKFKEFIYHLRVRYAEVMISAYKPAHQQLFYNAGLRPRGYIPSWQYDPYLNDFEDYVMFNWYDGKIENLKLIKEAKELKNMISLNKNNYNLCQNNIHK